MRCVCAILVRSWLLEFDLPSPHPRTMSSPDVVEEERPSVKIDLLDHKLLRRELEAETLQVLAT